MAQVREQTESTRSQYGLAETAAGRRWARTSIEVIDTDLGISGKWGVAREGFKLVESNIRTMLNTSAGARAWRLLPRLVITGTDLPSRVAGPGRERPPVGDCDAWRPRPRHIGPSACRVADGRAGGRANIRLRGRGCIGCNESGWLPGRARDATDDAEVPRVPCSCGAGRPSLAGSGDDAPDATGCSRMHCDASRRNDDAGHATESAASSLHQILWGSITRSGLAWAVLWAGIIAELEI